MAQFEVFENPRQGLFPLLLDIQTDLLSQLETRVVVPLAEIDRYGARPISRLNPVATIRGGDYVLVFQELAAVPRAALGERVDTLDSMRPALIAAIDLLFNGI